MAALHRDDDLRLGVRRRQRAGAHQLARRDLQSRVHRQSDPGLDHRPRDLPRLEREAAPAGRHGAVPLRPPEPTVWLWVSEGHHRLLRRPRHRARAAIVDPEQFLRRHRREDRRRWPRSRRRRSRTRRSPPGSTRPTAASTSTIQKGSLAGFMLDIMIRDASDNRRSLDDVMRELYRSTYKAPDAGSPGAQWWQRGHRRRPAGGASPISPPGTWTAASRIRGRRSCRWPGLRTVSDTIREPRLGLAAARDSGGGVLVTGRPAGQRGRSGRRKHRRRPARARRHPHHRPGLRPQVPRALRQGQRPGRSRSRSNGTRRP